MKKGKILNIVLLIVMTLSLVSALICAPILIFSLSSRAIAPLAACAAILLLSPLLLLMKHGKGKTILCILDLILLSAPIAACLYILLGIELGWYTFL